MYYSTTSTGYISTSSFAILNTGILTIEMWMKSQLSATLDQTIMCDNNVSNTVGFIFFTRDVSASHLRYKYATGSGQTNASAINILQGLDNQ